MSHKIVSAVAALLLLLLGSSNGYALNISFTGSFTQDDNVQFFNFNVGAPSLVTLRAWSYAGGTNAAGQVIPRGGFDTILALFNQNTGALIGQNDDGGCGNVSADALTGRCWDTFLQTNLLAGSYQVSIQEFNNFANGPNVSDGFPRQGQGNFTPAFTGATECPSGQFIDVSGVTSGRCRDGHWAFDILNVESAADVPTSPVPEPVTLVLLGSSLAFGAFAARRRR